MRPRVTVIIATYNWSTVLPYSIGSVLGQTFTDFELLVVGDGCTDDSEAVVQAIDDPRVQWSNLPENTRHQSGPNNDALSRARGDLIAYLGHDDLWLPHHLEVMVDAIDREDADLAHSLIANVAPDGRYLWPTIPRPADGNVSSPAGIVHRKRLTDAIGGWRHYHDVKEAPDVELWRRAHDAGRPFTFVPRLTGIKLPALYRRDVYVDRPCHEQAHWSARIRDEPDLEPKLLAGFLVGPPVPDGLPYRDLLRVVMRQTAARVSLRRAGAMHSRSQRRKGIDAMREFKGL